MMKRTIIIIASIILTFNILLLIQNSKLKKKYISVYNQNMELEFNFERQKNYIINNIQHPNITYNTILNEIEQYHPTDTAWALLIPSGVCMACASSLFSEIANLSVDANSFYLISEIPFEKLKREWYSHKFKHYSVAKNNSTFQHFNSNIYIAKLIQHDKKIEIFMYDSDLYEFLPYFILDKIIEASVQGKSGTNTLTCQNTFGSCIAWHPDGASKIQRGYVDDNKTKTTRKVCQKAHLHQN